MKKNKISKENKIGWITIAIISIPVIIFRLYGLINESLYLMLLAFIFIYIVSFTVSIKLNKDIENNNFYYLFWSPILAGFLGSYFFIAFTEPEKLPNFYITILFAAVYGLVIAFKMIFDKLKEKKH